MVNLIFINLMFLLMANLSKCVSLKELVSKYEKSNYKGGSICSNEYTNGYGFIFEEDMGYLYHQIDPSLEKNAKLWKKEKNTPEIMIKKFEGIELKNHFKIDDNKLLQDIKIALPKIPTFINIVCSKDAITQAKLCDYQCFVYAGCHYICEFIKAGNKFDRCVICPDKIQKSEGVVNKEDKTIWCVQK